MRPLGKWLIGSLASAAPLSASAAIDPFLEPRHPIEAPNGFTAMCSAHPDACAQHAAGGSMSVRQEDFEKLLIRINSRVNRDVRQVSDEVRFGRKDVWQASGIGRGAAGDCEDIALEKRKLLIDAGAPADRLFLAVAYGRRSVGLHLVLIARTDDGDVVLDSRSTSVTPWSNAPYTWIAMQSPDRPTVWFSV